MCAIFKSVFAVVMAVVHLLGLIAQPAAAYYTGACVKQPLSGSKPPALHYQIRVPHGQSYAEKDERFRGQTYYDHLNGCHPRDFTAIYDTEGNAHLDFTIPARKNWLLPNKCNVEERIASAAFGQYTPVCPVGNGADLAHQWRTSWKEE